MGKNSRFVLFFLGLLSGLLSSQAYWISGLGLFGSLVSTYAPGLFFGIVIAGWFLYAKKNYTATSFLKLASFVVVSVIAYHAAVEVTISSTQIISNFFLGGLTGALVLLLGFHFLFFKLNIKQFILILLLGGFLGFVGYHVSDVFTGSISSSEAPSTISLLTLYIIWQGGMAYAFGRAADNAFSDNVIITTK